MFSRSVARHRTFGVVFALGAAAMLACAIAGCSTGAGRSPSPSSTTGQTGTAPPHTAALSTATPITAPPITIASPAEGATVSVPFIAAGTADTFEAALTMDAVDASGEQLCVRHLMATSGSGTPGDWSGTLAFPPEARALAVTLRAYAHSAKDGSIIDLVEHAITVSPKRPPIIITTPVCGDTYESVGVIPVTGLATLFEAALTIELRDASGAAVLIVPVLAEACCVESNFSTTLTLPEGLASGFYDLVAFSVNPKDGAIRNEFTVQVELRH